MNGTMRNLLKQAFPWLETNEDAGSGADVIQALCDLHESLKRKPARVSADGRLFCPNCKKPGSFRYIEDIQNHRTVGTVNRSTKTLFIEGFYESGEGYDDGEDGRLECRNCYAECDLPAGYDVEFV